MAIPAIAGAPPCAAAVQVGQDRGAPARRIAGVRAEGERGLDSAVSGRDGVAKPGRAAGSADQQGNLPSLSRRHQEDDQREILEVRHPPTTSPVCGSTTAAVTWPLVAIWSSRPVRLRSSRPCRRACPELTTARPAGSAAISCGSSRPGSGRARRLAAGRVGKSPDDQLDVVSELLVQFLSGGRGPGRQPDREGRLPALIHAWHGVLHQGAGPLNTQSGQDHLEFVPDHHARRLSTRPRGRGLVPTARSRGTSHKSKSSQPHGAAGVPSASRPKRN